MSTTGDEIEIRPYDPAWPAEFAELAGRMRTALGERNRRDRRAYSAAKVPFSWNIISHADSWAQTCGWRPPPSDA